MFQKIIHTNASASILLIRLMVGVVFLSEGIQKFLFPALRGSGRFTKIGIPFPEFLGHFVGTLEILSGILLLLGLFTRAAAVPPLIIMLVAIATTKLALLMDESFWAMLHASRTDWAMLLGSLFLVIQGGGKWSIDLTLLRKQSNAKSA